ncbi:hypothetical protein [Mesobacillus jeotgali]|uniref:hypothetical protein n=1 Tax=Mesobacillus jeotgali TaxID=129985 RepID=UPI0009A63ACD|nr:hypothetical protein [Mesobacillus jeotgali]
MSLVILLVILLLLMLSFGNLSNKLFGARFMNGSGITKVFTGYVIVLLCTAILSLLIPKGETFPGKHLTDEEILANESLNSDIYSIVESGKVEEAEGLTKKKTWGFPLDGNNVLRIEALNLQAAVFVEKVESLDDKVEVTHYSTYSYINNIDITERFTSPDIQLSENSLKLFPMEHVNIELVTFTNAFPFNQFSEYGEQVGGNYGMMQGLDFIYIRVPAGIEISGEVHVIN